jgi:CRP/FNR family transcriptional regulator, cyclic AMP receptor protein
VPTGRIDLGQAVDDLGTGGPGRRWPAESLLARLPPAVRDELLARCRPVRFAPGEVLLRQGDTDRHAFVLLSGAVTIRVVEDGVDAVLAVRRRGDIVGELAALTGEPRSATVVAATPVLTGAIAGSAFANILTRHPQAAWEVVRTQAHRLEWANRRRVDFVSRRATARVARVLADLALDISTGDGRPIRVALTQRELATIVGTALNTAEIALRRLAGEGFIERRYRAVLVTDLPGLVEFADRESDKP